jgi:hypothetical protein
MAAVHLACPSCGTLYDASGYPPGHAFTCACGQAMVVPEAAPAAPGPVLAQVGGGGAEAVRSTPPAPGPDPGLDPWVKVLVFLGNLCFTPLIGLIAWVVVRRDRPRTASEICTLTWIPVALWAAVVVVMVILTLIGGA